MVTVNPGFTAFFAELDRAVHDYCLAREAMADAALDPRAVLALRIAAHRLRETTARAPLSDPAGPVRS